MHHVDVLVTGGAGFIGANLCRRLLEHPRIQRVVVLDDLSTGDAANLEDLDVDLVRGSILDMAALEEVVSRVTAVAHLAARPSVPRSLLDPFASHEANATGTLRVLQAAQRHGCHVVVASSSSVYGGTPTLPKSEDLPARPLSPYAVSKLATEAYAGAFTASFGVPTLAFRFFNVYGPLQAANHAYAAVVPAFIDAALDERPLVVHGDGLQSRDFTFVGTVTEVLTQALVQGIASSDPVNLAYGTRTTLLDLIGMLEGELRRPLPREHGEARRGDVRSSQASQTRLRALFPDVVPVSLEAGLAQTLHWFRSVRGEA